MLTCQERRAKVGIFCNNQAALVKGRLSNDIFGYDPKLRPVELHISIPAKGAIAEIDENTTSDTYSGLDITSYRIACDGLASIYFAGLQSESH